MKENISVSLAGLANLVPSAEVKALAQKSLELVNMVNSGTGAGNDFLGWVKLPENVQARLDSIEKAAKHIRSVSSATVVIGIGGSYLGARAVIEALSHLFPNQTAKKQHEVFYAGHNICEDYMAELLEVLENKNYSIVVISKSGTTTEPALAFRLLKDHLERKVGKSVAADRIIAITDARKGALRSLAEINGYETFVIPDDVGGRYSVLTPVGLLPIAIAGYNIREFVKGAIDMASVTRDNRNAETNPSLIYAAARNAALRAGKTVEVLVNYHSKLHYVAEWWKQLYGESEGKEGKGIFPAAVDLTTDLHSMGQYIQEGQRFLLETVLSVKTLADRVKIPSEKDDSDQLNYIAGKRMSEVNKSAETGTILAHNDGNVPVISVQIPLLDIYYLGQLMYFFEYACALS